MLSEAAERNLKDGDPAAALARLQEDVRARPSDAKLRVFLFQLLCVVGQWERALTQLKVASELEPLALPMAQMYGDAVRCEAVRDEVFEGRKSPMVLGQPDQWLALLIESRLRAGLGEHAQAEDLRLRAFEDAPASAGDLNGQRFEWIADGDSRIGPVLEAIINGRYYWVPFDRLSKLTIEPPEDLRDLVWMPAHMQFQNGGETLALIPTRYPGSESTGDGALALARKTAWEAFAEDAYRGLGQRIFATDAGETPFLEVRAIAIQQDESVPDLPGADNA
ncbi:MAG TPA: type VI secretion system accessory protein TagJ [Vicinamibacterales bacterium]|nr:type VI secretion system accessory protein TagJ [Vicinamibacterales bacterium]